MLNKEKACSKSKRAKDMGEAPVKFNVKRKAHIEIDWDNEYEISPPGTMYQSIVAEHRHKIMNATPRKDRPDYYSFIEEGNIWHKDWLEFI